MGGLILLIVLTVLWASPGARATIPRGCQGRLDVVFVMDESESIRESSPPGDPDHNWNVFRRFVKAVITGLPIESETQTALMKYSTDVDVIWSFGQITRANEMLSAVDRLSHNGGNTNTAKALVAARDWILSTSNRPDANDVIILMTDGLSTIDSDRVGIEAQRTHDLGIEIYVVAVGEYIDEEELHLMAKDFSKNTIRVTNFDALESIQNLLLYRVCDLPDPDPDFVKPPDCSDIMDLAFIVDNSGSVRNDYQELKEFLANVVEQLDLRPDGNRVGVVRYSDIATLEVPLGAYASKAELKRRILDMPFRDLDTNTSGGLRLTRLKIFSGSPGDRPEVRNIGILITDGVSTVEQDRTILEAERAKRAGITLFVVGVTQEINLEELHAIASEPPSEHYFASTAVKYLNALIYRLLTNVCSSN